MANVSREQKRITRERIQTSAARLFAEKGFAQTTVREIAEAAKASESSIFTYFDSKDELLVRIVLPEETSTPFPINLANPWQGVIAVTRAHFAPFAHLDKRLLCEYQAALNRATPNPESRIVALTARRDKVYVDHLRQVLEVFQIEETPIVMEIVIAIVLCVFQAFMTRPEFTFAHFLAQVEEQVRFLLKATNSNPSHSFAPVYLLLDA